MNFYVDLQTKLYVYNNILTDSRETTFSPFRGSSPPPIENNIIAHRGFVIYFQELF